MSQLVSRAWSRIHESEVAIDFHRAEIAKWRAFIDTASELGVDADDEYHPESAAPGGQPASDQEVDAPTESFAPSAGESADTNAGNEPAQDGGEFPAVKAANGRLGDADGVEPPPSTTDPDAAPGEAMDANASPQKPTLVQRIRVVLDDDPDATAHAIAMQLGETRTTIDMAAKSVGLKLRAEGEAVDQEPAMKVEKPPTLKDRVRTVHRQYPNWTASMIAKELGAKETSVSATLAVVRREEANG